MHGFHAPINNSPENIDHLFWGCPKAAALWDTIPSGQRMRDGFVNSTFDWISVNLKKQNTLSIGNEVPWNVLFCSTLWQNWKDWNRKSFDNFDSDPTVSSKVLCCYVAEIVEAYKSILLTGPLKHKLTPWFPPSTGNIKLNTDGCWYESTRKAGFGGIFRDDKGSWILGYHGKTAARSSLETEIWSIYKGLTIILERGLSNVQIESDSQTAVILFNDGPSANLPQSNILHDGRYLLNRTGSTLTHIYRGANKCADFLAHLGAEQEQDLVVSSSQPVEIREYMNRDSLHLRQILD